MSKHVPKVAAHAYHVCIHDVLPKYLKYTHELALKNDRDTNESSAMVFVYDARFISRTNLRQVIDKRGRAEDRLPYGVRFQPFEFVAFQKRLSISRSVFLHPYDWQSWVSFLTTSMLILIMTMTFYRNLGKLMPTTLSIFVVALEQPVSLQLRKGVNRGSKMVSLSWLVWFVLLVVVVNGYKGTLFSLITRNPKPVWPK